VTSVNADGEERLFEVGEWVKLIDDGKYLRPGSIGVVHGIGQHEDGSENTVNVAFCGVSEHWVGPPSMLERVDKFLIGQKVRVKPDVKQTQFGWSGQHHETIGSISSIDADGKLRVSTTSPKAWILDPSEVELVEEETPQVGDWVKVKSSVTTPIHHWGEVTHSSVGVVHRIEDGEIFVSFCFLDRLWICKESEIEKVRAFEVGNKVRFKDGLLTPRWGWGMETPNSKGEVAGVDANGKVRIKFKWRDGRPWIGDPADIVFDEERNGGLMLESYFD
jgi:E3 ubiquitin-protein ligase KEG